jgi:hypothetical protein
MNLVHVSHTQFFGINQSNSGYSGYAAATAIAASAAKYIRSQLKQQRRFCMQV